MDYYCFSYCLCVYWNGRCVVTVNFIIIIIILQLLFFNNDNFSFHKVTDNIATACLGDQGWVNLDVLMFFLANSIPSVMSWSTTLIKWRSDSAIVAFSILFWIDLTLVIISFFLISFLDTWWCNIMYWNCSYERKVFLYHWSVEDKIYSL